MLSISILIKDKWKRKEDQLIRLCLELLSIKNTRLILTRDCSRILNKSRIRKSLQLVSQLVHWTITFSFGTPISEVLKAHYTKEAFSIWSWNSLWVTRTTHQQLQFLTQFPTPTYSETTSVWTSSDRLQIDRKVRAGHQLTVSKVSWLNFKVSSSKRILTKTKIKSFSKLKRLSKKPIHTNVKFVNMVASSHVGPLSPPRKTTRMSSKFLKMKIILFEKNSSAITPSSATNKINWVWVWKFQKSQELEISEKPKHTTITFQSKHL